MRGLYLFLFVLLPTVFFGQATFKDIKGFVNEKGEQLFEIEGYSVSVHEIKGSIDDQSVQDLVIRNYQLDQILRIYTDPSIKVHHKIIESSIIESDFPLRINQKCLLLQTKADYLTVLYLETSLDRDLKIEKEIITAFLNGKLTNRINPEKVTSAITIAGKKMELLVEAKRIAPNKIINENAQISWSVFSSKSRANQYISNQIMIDKASDVDYVKEDEIDILFDKKAVKARRIVYHDPLIETQADYLISYHLVYKLGSEYVACILSYYEYSDDVLYLPALLKSIMQIPYATDDEYSFSEEQKDLPNYWTIDYNDTYMLEVYAGTMLPFGSLKDVYKLAPSFGTYFGIPVANRMAIDVGFQFAFPINSSFEYFYGDNSSEYAKAETLLGGNVRWRNLLHQTGYWSYWGYLGVGVNYLITNIVDENSYDWETNTYEKYSITSLDLLAGFNIRYKNVGVFAEYHFTPYGNSDRLKYNFGNSSFNLGFKYFISLKNW